MDVEQFAAFMITFQYGITALVPAQNNNNNPKISVRISTFKGAPKDNVMTWMLQVQNLFNAQGVEDDQKKIYYAATGFEEAALHWYLNKVAAAKALDEDNAFANWADFATHLKYAFQPLTINNILNNNLKP